MAAPILGEGTPAVSMPVYWAIENTEFIQKWKGFSSPFMFSFSLTTLPASLPATKSALSLCTSYNYLNVLHILQARHMTLRCYSEKHHVDTYRNRNTRGLPAEEHLVIHDTQLTHCSSLENVKKFQKMSYFSSLQNWSLTLVNFLSKLGLAKVSQSHLRHQDS